MKSRYKADGEATLTAYSIIVDDKTVAYGQLSPAEEMLFTYVIDTYDMMPGKHQLKTTFWNSYGIGVTEQAPFLVLEVPKTEGDVNADGQVTAADIWMLMGIIARGGTIEEHPSADVNADGRIDIGDVNTAVSIMAR